MPATALPCRPSSTSSTPWATRGSTTCPCASIGCSSGAALAHGVALALTTIRPLTEVAYMDSPVSVVEVRRGTYHDSVTLMLVSRTVADVDGVTAAQVAMGTELNLDVLRGMGFAPPPDVGPCMCPLNV